MTIEDTNGNRTMQRSLTPGLTASRSGSPTMRLRTLILLRWLAIGGQLLAITLAHRRYGLDLPLGLCYLVVGAAIVANLIAVFVFPENKRLTELEALLTLLFDVAQLALLLYLTGGLTNPFALLVVAPVTISATILTLRSTVLLGVTAIGLITLLTFFHLPLRLRSGEVLMVPPLIEFGTWLAIVIGIGFLGIYSRRVSVEMRSMSEALLATQMALAREQKLTDLGGVVAAAAHELGTPLGTIAIVAGELERQLEGSLAEDARLIRSEVARCRAVLDSLAARSGDVLGASPERLDLVALANALREKLPSARAKRLVVTGEGSALAPRAPLLQALEVLVQNAFDASGPDADVELLLSDDRVEVRDHGAGMDAATLERACEPFFTTKPEGVGMGLGLFLARSTAEALGGTLMLTSKVGEGTRAVLSLHDAGAPT